jgi:hypothetical protein
MIRFMKCTRASALLAILLILQFSSMAKADLMEGLIGYWPFDGDGADLSGAERHFQLFGGVGFDTGLFDQALDLHGNASQFARRPTNDAVYGFGSSNFTISIWANFNSLNNPTLVEKFQGRSGPTWTLVGFTPFADLHFYANHGSVVLNASLPDARIGVWHHMVIRRNVTAFDMFFDGAIVASGNSNESFLATETPLLIGKRNPQDGRDFPVDGRIDELAIWNRALSDSEVTHIHNGGLGNLILPDGNNGDFNRDGDVNAADYVVWRNDLGLQYTETDYDIWRANFDTANLSNGAIGVPEPSGVALALFAFAPLLSLYRSHHRGSPAWKRVCRPEIPIHDATRRRHLAQHLVFRQRSTEQAPVVPHAHIA